MPDAAGEHPDRAGHGARPPVAAILHHLRDGPSRDGPSRNGPSRTWSPRTWSVVMTVFGDAVVPRGGSLGVRSLLGILAGMGIGGGVVRTALSRLSADGWLQATRVGRRSFYELTGTGCAAVAAASARIYGPPAGSGDGRVSILLPDAGTDRGAAREALRAAGFGALASGVWIAPASRPVPAGAGLLRVEATPDAETGRRLADQAWPLAATADAYRRFVQAFAPLRQWARDGQPFPDLDAMVARILLVHEYRRVALRDPHLPAALLPVDWPGTDAWELCHAAYPALLPGSERWLDRHGQGVDGPLPPASDELGQRFRSRDHITVFA